MSAQTGTERNGPESIAGGEDVAVGGAPARYRIEELARLSGATVRTIRAYQDRGLLPKPERHGRANLYGDRHLSRLRQIADLLTRGYTLASIRDLLEAWDAGRGLGGVLGLVAEVDGPWSDEVAGVLTRAELDAMFGGVPDDAAVEDAVALGVLERLPAPEAPVEGGATPPERFRVPSPQELAVAAELHAAGVPLHAVGGHLREVRSQVEHLAARFVDFTAEHVFRAYLDHPPTETEATRAAELVRRLRPLARHTVDAELARALRTLATRYLHHHLRRTPGEGSEPRAQPGLDHRGTAGADPGAGFRSDVGAGSATGDWTGSGTGDGTSRGAGAGADEGTEATAPASAPVRLPAPLVEAVRELVGEEHIADFVHAATAREVHARHMDAYSRAPGGPRRPTGSGHAPAPSPTREPGP